MNGFLAIAWRDVRLAWTGGGLWLPIVFYLAVATLFPFAAGPRQFEGQARCQRLA